MLTEVKLAHDTAFNRTRMRMESWIHTLGRKIGPQVRPLTAEEWAAKPMPTVSWLTPKETIDRVGRVMAEEPRIRAKSDDAGEGE